MRPAPMERAVLHSTARFYTTFARLPQIAGLPGWIRREGVEHYREARARGRGVLVASGHVGNWELGAHAQGLWGEPLHLVVRTYPDQAVHELAARYRTLSGNRVLPGNGAARMELVPLAILSPPALEPSGSLISRSSIVRAARSLR